MIDRFGECELDQDQAELRRAGQPFEMKPKPFALLAFVIAARERVVAKDEPLRELWPDAEVTESSLSKAVLEPGPVQVCAAAP